MISYNNIVAKGEPDDKDRIDHCLDGCTVDTRHTTQSTADPRVDCIVVDDFLTSDECDKLIETCEEVGYTFWKQLEHSDADGESNCDAASKSVRVVDTIEANLPVLAKRIFDRIVAAVDLQPKVFSEDMENAVELFDRCIAGVWTPHCISENLLLGRYKPGGHFMPHIDGSTILDMNTRSFYTLLIYLNDFPAGGETHLFEGEQCNVMFLDNDSNKYRGSADRRVGSVVPKKGRAAFFYYDLLHEGAPVTEGLKYICRADLLYRRTPPILTNPKDMEAFALYQEAGLVESNGDAFRACEMLQRVVKLSRGVAELYQLV